MRRLDVSIALGVLSLVHADVAAAPPGGAGALAPLPLLPGDTDGDAFAINDAGTVAGVSGGSAVFWDASGAVHRLGDGVAFGLNQGGWAAVQRGRKPWVCDTKSGSEVALGLADGAPGCQVRGIAEPGDVVGWCRVGDGPRAVIWERDNEDGPGTVPVVLPSFDEGPSIGYAIDDRGIVVGQAVLGDAEDGVPVAWLPGPGGYQIVALPVTAGELGFARAISERGQIVGTTGVPWSWTVARGVAATQLAGSSALGPEGVANGVNARGEIVGFLGVNGGEPPDQPLGAVWSAAGTAPRLLGVLAGGTYSFPRAINNRGDIAGSGDDASGHSIPWVLRR